MNYFKWSTIITINYSIGKKFGLLLYHHLGLFYELFNLSSFCFLSCILVQVSKYLTMLINIFLSCISVYLSKYLTMLINIFNKNCTLVLINKNLALTTCLFLISFLKSVKETKLRHTVFKYSSFGISCSCRYWYCLFYAKITIFKITKVFFIKLTV